MEIYTSNEKLNIFYDNDLANLTNSLPDLLNVCKFNESGKSIDFAKSDSEYKLYIVSFMYSNVFNEEEITQYRSKGNMYDIYIYANEGRIPHFHILKQNEPDTCIEILNPKYFSHGIHTGTLPNTRTCKDLNKVLSMNYEQGVTNYEKIKIFWVDHCQLPKGYTIIKFINTNQPNYSILNKLI